MRSVAVSAALLSATCAIAAPVDSTSGFDKYTNGFKNATVEHSIGGHAICISGTIDVAASSQNVHFNVGPLNTQIEATEFFAEALQINSTLAERVVGKPFNVSGTYGIYSQLCFPKSTGTINDKTIQFLIHGAGADRTYWNFAPGYSYVDYAAEQGYNTFIYDRLGIGLSDHPDPIQVLQTGLEVNVAHALIQHLRAGNISGQAFKNVVGIGHSFGSIQTNLVLAEYVADYDAAVLTGFTAKPDGFPVAFAGSNPSIASQNDPSRFGDLPPGYLIPARKESNQFFFFRAPNFDPKILTLFEQTKQTESVGEFLSSSVVQSSPKFTGPIFVAAGENDMPNCQGDCMYPYNKIEAVKHQLYPAASNSSGWYIAPNTGHALTLHYTAKEANKKILDFIKSNGF